MYDKLKDRKKEGSVMLYALALNTITRMFKGHHTRPLTIPYRAVLDTATSSWRDIYKDLVPYMVRFVVVALVLRALLLQSTRRTVATRLTPTLWWVSDGW